MTTSIDPSIDELLLLQENQYHMSNFIIANIKPIGAERKIGQTSTISQTKSPQRFDGYPINMDFIQENNNQLNSFEIPSTSSFNFRLFSNEEPIIQQTNNSLRSSYNYNHQRQPISLPQPKLNQSISTRAKLIPSFHVPQIHPTNRFSNPHSRNSFLNILPPFHCTRERFQVNSIGRPILRGTHIYGFKIRQ